jgi:hypothetical protein
MGTIIHHGMMITSSSKKHINMVHRKAIRLFDDPKIIEEWGGKGLEIVSPIFNARMGGYYSFCIFPDGSQEGWDMSDDYEELRHKLIEYIWERRYKDGSNSVDFVEFRYGGDCETSEVVNFN